MGGDRLGIGGRGQDGFIKEGILGQLDGRRKDIWGTEIMDKKPSNLVLPLEPSQS